MVLKKNAQSSVEFILVISFMLFVLIGFLSVYGNYYGKQQEKKYATMIDDLAQVIIAEVQMANYVQDGYSRTFELPMKLKGLNYIIKLTNSTNLGSNINFSELVINYDTEIIQLSNRVFLLPPNMEGNFNSGGENNITKKNGHMCINC